MAQHSKSAYQLIEHDYYDVETIQNEHKAAIISEVESNPLLTTTAKLLPVINWQILKQLRDAKVYAPRWIDTIMAEKVLKEVEDQTRICVYGCVVKTGSMLGDNFSSAIYRAYTRYTKAYENEMNTMTMIFKVPPLNGKCIKNEVSKDGQLFAKELFMYSTVVPAMENLLGTVKDKTVFGPRLLYNCGDPVGLVFEDIKERGYYMSYKLINLQTAELVFTKLAKWHASSVIAAEQVPKIKNLTKNFVDIGNDHYKTIWQATIQKLSEILATWPEYEKYANVIAKFKEPIFEKLRHIFDPASSIFCNVLNHGDCHNRNMMFKDGDGKIEDILFYDYQLSVWGTPAIDIIYVLYNSCSCETRDDHRDQLIKLYYDEFVTTLKKLGYKDKIPSLLNLRMEILRCGHFESFLACTFLPFMMSSFEELIIIGGASPTELASKPERMDDVRNYFFQKNDYVKVIQRYLPVFLNQGLFDL
ncbi:uncharacterized protein LOC129777825 [Toxorhynchites rutilus septentrionalis]|uniref:uncharacterized protein LOC129777825 n=1 Tax=Toxorhynchites rutilus septentrionalis TaxID=329112 RepID=UPI00247869B0|nr:uncharacterized protein LOC129777825 [Toxorhynchites rutilus septentrionalis]